MKTIEQIKANPRIAIGARGEDGFSGIISMPTWKGTFICSVGAGWEHVSVSPSKHRIVPSWDDMCRTKEIFWKDDEAVIQIHPPKEDYVDNLSNCLHLWRCTYKEMVLPPSVLVGVRKGQDMNQFMKELVEAYAIAGTHLCNDCQKDYETCDAHQGDYKMDEKTGNVVICRKHTGEYHRSSGDSQGDEGRAEILKPGQLDFCM
jgi:hypothetical protein